MQHRYAHLVIDAYLKILIPALTLLKLFGTISEEGERMSIQIK